MKKSLILFAAASIALTSAFSFAGCGSSEEKKTTSATEAAETKQESAESRQNTGVIPESDTTFTCNGYAIELNGSIDDMIANIGEANNVESQLSCHGEGDDKTFTYDNFVVNSYPLDGKDYVMEILITTAGVPTSKGIEVGSSADDVVAAYGSDYKEIGMYYAYDANEKKSLRFLMEDGTVKEIDYYYTV